VKKFTTEGHREPRREEEKKRRRDGGKRGRGFSRMNADFKTWFSV
jgi:hypothetical protein